jgi:hypothetical protein
MWQGGLMIASERPAGASDFDFLFGSWHIVNKRLISRLTHAQDWEEFPAHHACRPILGGVGNTEEFRPVWPGREGFEGGSLRLFNPETRLWSIYWIDNVRCAIFPPVVGCFTDGVGEFFGDDQEGDQPVRVRFRWSAITANSARWEQAFSADGGEHWETNWTMAFTRSTAQ